MLNYRLHVLLPTHRSQDLSNTIWALAVLRYQPDGTWWEQFERQVRADKAATVAVAGHVTHLHASPNSPVAPCGRSHNPCLAHTL